MTYRALIPAVALLAVLSGCENKPADAPKATTEAKVTPLPPAAPAAPAASANQDAAGSPAAQTAAVVDTKQGATPTAAAPACKNGANCEIKVMVAGDPCRITKHPEKKHVARGKPEKLTWTIQNTAGANWDFDKNGVAFSGPNAGNFTCKPAGAGKYECDDSNPQATKTEVPYAITVKDGTKTCTNDPMIVNGADDVNNE